MVVYIYVNKKSYWQTDVLLFLHSLIDDSHDINREKVVSYGILYQ